MNATQHMIRITLILISTFLAGHSHAAPPAPAQQTVEVVGAEFGTFSSGEPLELALEPTRVVPNKVGQRYGWIIEVRSSKRALSVREEYLLPNASGAQNAKAPDPAGESQDISAQRLKQVSQRQLVPMDGTIYGEWTIGSGELAGHRHLQVVIEGRVAASFEFEVK